MAYFRQADESWRRRKWYECQNKGVTYHFHPEGALFAYGMIAEPDNWDGRLGRTAVSVVMTVVYDKPDIISGNNKSVSHQRLCYSPDACCTPWCSFG